MSWATKCTANPDRHPGEQYHHADRPVLVSLVLNWSARALGFSGPADIGALPLLALTFGIFGVITLPLNNAYSRGAKGRRCLRGSTPDAIRLPLARP